MTTPNSKTTEANLARFRPAFRAAEQKYRLQLGALEALAKIESGGDPNAKAPLYAKNGTHIGGLGLMQFVESTAKEVGLKNRLDPIASIDAAGNYFSRMLRAAKGDTVLAAQYWNMGAAGGRRFMLENDPTVRGDKDFHKKFLAAFEGVTGTALRGYDAKEGRSRPDVTYTPTTLADANAVLSARGDFDPLDALLPAAGRPGWMDSVGEKGMGDLLTKEFQTMNAEFLQASRENRSDIEQVLSPQDESAA